MRKRIYEIPIMIFRFNIDSRDLKHNIDRLSIDVPQAGLF